MIGRLKVENIIDKIETQNVIIRNQMWWESMDT